MIPRRFILGAISLVSFATACTAIVLGKVGDTEDYKTVPIGTSPSAGPQLDECSLLKGDNYGGDRDANACATCIQDNCATDVTYACNAGASKSPKPWFGKLKDCAQDPWNGFKPPGEPSGFYGCKAYETPAEEISDNGSDTEREPQSHNCVNTNCLKGALPPCKMCEVHIQKPSSSEQALLRDDDCGKCLVTECPQTLVKCCGTEPMGDMVKFCAFTKLTENKDKCLELGKTQHDGGPFEYTINRYSEESKDCFDELSACFQTKCTKTAYKCK